MAAPLLGEHFLVSPSCLSCRMIKVPFRVVVWLLLASVSWLINHQKMVFLKGARQQPVVFEGSRTRPNSLNRNWAARGFRAASVHRFRPAMSYFLNSAPTRLQAASASLQ